MEIKELLKSLTLKEMTIMGDQGLSGKNLKQLEPLLKNVEEFQSKNIEVIEFIDDTLVTIKDVDSLQENIKIQSIFLLGEDVYIRCTVDSLKK